MKTLIAAIMLCCLMAGAGHTYAQPVSEAETLALQAKEQFKAGSYEPAAKLFMRAYAKSHVPALIYNAARAYEEAGKKGDAIALYRMFITLTNDAEGILEARQRIAKLEAAVKSIVVTPAAPPPVPLPAAPTPVVAVSKVRVVNVTKPSNRTAAWLTTSGSAVLVGVGLSLMVDGASGTRQYAGVNRASFDASRTEWGVGLGMVGAGAIVGGVSIYLWNKSVTAMPTPAGVVVGGSF